MNTSDTQANPASAINPTIPLAERNAYLFVLFQTHPDAEFNEQYFFDLLQGSLSLSLYEKKRVIDAIPTLSQFQIDELISVFENEREEFRTIFQKEEEKDVLSTLVKQKKQEWEDLYWTYQREQVVQQQKSEDEQKLEMLRAALGGEDKK